MFHIFNNVVKIDNGNIIRLSSNDLCCQKISNWVQLFYFDNQNLKDSS